MCNIKIEANHELMYLLPFSTESYLSVKIKLKPFLIAS